MRFGLASLRCRIAEVTSSPGVLLLSLDRRVNCSAAAGQSVSITKSRLEKKAERGSGMNNLVKSTGYPSINKPRPKHYDREAIESPLPECAVCQYVRDANADNLGAVALNYYGRDHLRGAARADRPGDVGALGARGAPRRHGDGLPPG